MTAAGVFIFAVGFSMILHGNCWACNSLPPALRSCNCTDTFRRQDSLFSASLFVPL